MKKHKMHIMAISIIIVMQIFSLGTSPTEYTEITLINNSSQNLRFRIFDWHWLMEYLELATIDDIAEEELAEYIRIFELINLDFILIRGDRIILDPIFTGRSTASPWELGLNIIVYNEDNEIIKEFHSRNGNFSELFFNFRGRRGGFLGGTSRWTLRITDELLE